MTEKRFITVGTDGSDGGRRALAWALRNAAVTGATVHVVTAWSWDGMAFAYGNMGGPDEARAFAAKQQKMDIDQVLADFVGTVPDITTQVVEGHPSTVLINAASSSDLLVLGSHGRGYLAATLFGSVSEACIRRGRTPVLVVPAHAPAAVAA